MCDSEVALAEDLEVELLDDAGYNWVTIRARCTENVTDRERAYALVKARFQDSVSTYYEFVSQGLLRNTARRFIEVGLEDLIDSHRASRFRSWIRRLWSGGRKANDLMLEILAADLEQRRASESSVETWAALESSAGAKALDGHVKRELRYEPEDDIVNAREIVDLLNARHGQALQTVAVVIASVLGGAIGAVLTAAAGLAAGGGA